MAVNHYDPEVTMSLIAIAAFAPAIVVLVALGAVCAQAFYDEVIEPRSWERRMRRNYESARREVTAAAPPARSASFSSLSELDAYNASVERELRRMGVDYDAHTAMIADIDREIAAKNARIAQIDEQIAAINAEKRARGW